MNNTFNFFDKIFCINLAKRPDRWEQSLQVFKELDLYSQINRFEANDYSDNESIPSRDRGRCGCAQSFLDIIKIAKKENYKNVLIFEDDILLYCSPQFVNDHLSSCIKELPLDWETFYLSANPLNHVPGCVINYSENLCVVTSAFCCHAIAINSNAYDTILQAFETQYNNDIKKLVNANVNFDGFCMATIQPRHKTYMPKQLLFTQRNNFSNIDYSDRDINSIIIQTYKENPLLLT